MTSEFIAPNKLEQFKEEIKQVLGEAINNSQFSDVVRKYGLTGDDLFEFQCILDTSKLGEFSETEEGQQTKELLQAAIPKDMEKVLVLQAAWCLACYCWCGP